MYPVVTKSPANIEISGKLYTCFTVLGAACLFIPGLIAQDQPRNESYESGKNSSINDNPFIHSILAAMAVSFTLICDGLLDMLYGSSFASSIGGPRWLLLLSIAVPNSAMYFDHSTGYLDPVVFGGCTNARELCLQAALLFFHYDLTSSKIVRGIIWLVLLCNIIAYNILSVDDYWSLGTGPKLISFVLIGISFISVMALALYRVVILFKANICDGHEAILMNVLSAAYTVCLTMSILIKYVIFIISTTRSTTLGTRYTLYTVIDIAVVLVLSTMHSRIAKMESLSSQNMLVVKRNFVRYISHEIRTPLNTISMGIQYVRRALGEVSESNLDISELNDMLNDVSESCNIAIEILNSILTYDKLECGDLVLNTETIKAFNLIRDSLHPFEIQAANVGIQFEYEGPHMSSEVSNALLSVDISKASQVFRNLISNALKYTPAGGSVIVSSCVSPAFDRAADSIRDKGALDLVVSVKDTGIGITPENQIKLFKEIIQFDELHGGSGAGLGLWLSNAIMSLHHGTISVQSTGIPGEGCTFTVRFPVFLIPTISSCTDEMSELEMGQQTMSSNLTIRHVHPLVNNENQQTPSSIALNRNQSTLPPSEDNIFPLPCCLVVDDARSNIKLLSRFVKPYFSEQGSAQNGQEAVDLVSATINPDGSCKYSTIFMDSIMPVMNGLEATREIRNLGYTGLLVGVTGNVLPEQISEFKDVGVNYVVPKPVNIKYLHQILTDHFSIDPSP